MPLVVLCQLEVRLDILDVPAALDAGNPTLPGFRGFGQARLALEQLPQPAGRLQAHVVRQGMGQRVAIRALSLGGAAGLVVGPAQGRHIQGVDRLAGPRIGQQAGQGGGQGDHGEDVFLVVIEDAHQVARIAALQILKVEGGDQPARHIGLRATQTQHFRLQAAQCAGRQALAPDAPRRVQEIEVRRVC